MPLSPVSPSKGAALNRVGGENIAALRERMSQIQIAYSQTRRNGAAGSSGGGGEPTASGNAVAEEQVTAVEDGPPGGGFSPLTGDGGGLEAIQRRIRDLSGGGVAQA